MNRNCILTVITDNYDPIIEPSVTSEGWDYICVTDNSEIDSNIWSIKDINPSDKKIECPKRRANSVIMKYWEYISSDYETLIIIDGNMRIIDDLNKLLDEFNFDPNEVNLMIGQHPDRNCVYAEADEIKKLKKDDNHLITKHVSQLRNANYPRRNGLNESGVLIISRNSEECMKFFKIWYSNYISMPSKRDQMSFNYSMWLADKEVKIKECPRRNGSNPRERRPFCKYFQIVKPH